MSSLVRIGNVHKYFTRGSERIDVLQVAIDERLVDDGDERCLESIGLGEVAAGAERYAQDVEVAGGGNGRNRGRQRLARPRRALEPELGARRFHRGELRRRRDGTDAGKRCQPQVPTSPGLHA